MPNHVEVERIIIMNNEYRGYSLFRDIENPSLRAWNRCAVLFNIEEDLGEGASAGYASTLTDAERMAVIATFVRIKEIGYEATKREIFREHTQETVH